MVRLVPMEETEFNAYRESAIVNFAQEQMKAGNWSPERAIELSEQEFQRLLPDGIVTENQYLCTIEDEESGNTVGILWFAVREGDTGPKAFVYDIVIYEEYRRRGYGMQAFQALEEKAKEMGLKAIALHVFGHNHAARRMYEKLGYEVVGMHMSKKLL
jgi:ribosomal protein S18 acetylase RimI-like enzyme